MKNLKQVLFLFLLATVCAISAHAQPDPFLHKLYDSLHDSPMQQKFRRLAPMPAGVVYVQQPDEGETEIREHFRTMKRLGFNALKQILTVPPWTEQQVGLLALEEGIVPWWYGEGGYAEIDDTLLVRLKISRSLPLAEVLAHPAMVAHQREVLKKRIEKIQNQNNASQPIPMAATSRAFDPEIGKRGDDLNEKGEFLFVEWLKSRYGTVEKLNYAWNQHHAGLFRPDLGPFKNWDDVANNWKDTPRREYNHVKDIYRFKVDHNYRRILNSAAQFNAFDPAAPYRGGGELAVFHPIAWYNVDMEGIARSLTDYGSFYPSMHFSWHYNLTEGEVCKSLYMQASLMNDFNKGGWTGGWESTGGPQQMDGEKDPGHDNAYYAGEGEIIQLYLSQLAAGFKGFGVWSWNARSAGKEEGEYALLDRSGQVTDRAEALGKIGQAMQKYRIELWQAHKEPLVGVLYDWENEATWGATSTPGDDDFKLQPVRARIGISNALMEANVPYEYVTPDNLKKGLSGRYKMLYLPAMLSIRLELLPLLHQYVEQGGRLVMDLPSARFDENTAHLPVGKGSVFEQIFGCTLDDFQYAGTNRPQFMDGRALYGYTMDATPTTAKVLAKYDNGQPAILENSLGKGQAVLLGLQSSINDFTQNFTKKGEGRQAGRVPFLPYVLGNYQSPYACANALAYRLASPAADHYFLINQGPATTASLNTKFMKYRQFTDAVTGEVLNASKIPVDGFGGRWVRAVR
ncbi:beta-galactosidase trimerization domain-containing protein [Persicitalea jodogahamensis]|uniref:beta-galactosidase n=1 Tax=Persicitalea jodogahamensis TaxID=402147 RepID=A0A8J3DDD0_9BACT|nr:beta-galactosidase trimerization domain-containing protein [Persicitalea jodogahamensis]GHB86619.1 hypothetical protein GCM10007390_47810 [Persicitalea jodogahamensis]